MNPVALLPIARAPHPPMWCHFAAVLAAAQTQRPPAPTLTTNTSHALTISWPQLSGTQPATQHYQLQLSVARAGSPDFHIVRHVEAGKHSLYWPDLPERADNCFRVALVPGAQPEEGDENQPPPVYSAPTCHSGCSCASAGGGADGGGGCARCALGGALCGAALALFGGVLFIRRGGVESCPKQVRGLVHGKYAHLTTAEPGLELEERPPLHAAATAATPISAVATPPAVRPGPLPPCTGSGAASQVASGAAYAALPPPPQAPPPHPSRARTLDPPADINGAEFEMRWSACTTRSHTLVGQLPGQSLPPSAPDEVEAALVSEGFFCVAAGAVGEQHKLYFAGELRGTRQWLMMELVLHWHSASVQATFRCDDHERLQPLADGFVGVPSRHVICFRHTLPPHPLPPTRRPPPAARHLPPAARCPPPAARYR